MKQNEYKEIRVSSKRELIIILIPYVPAVGPVLLSISNVKYRSEITFNFKISRLNNPTPPKKKGIFFLTGFLRTLSSVLLSPCVIIFTIINSNYSNKSSNYLLG